MTKLLVSLILLIKNSNHGSDKVKGYVLVKVQRLNRMGDMLPVRKERRNFDHGSLSGQIADLLSLNQRDLLLD